MLKDLFTREDKIADRGRPEKREYNPMPEGWKPRSPGPVIPASLPPHLRPAGQGVPDTVPDAGRPGEPPRHRP